MSAEFSVNETKINNLGLFDDVKNFTSIKEKSGLKKYEFIDLTSDEIKYLKSIVETLEKDEGMYLCARGDSKKDEHENFIKKQLYDFFIVGDKANFHKYIVKPDEPYRHVKNNGELIDIIEQLVEKCNDVQRKITGREDICGMINSQLISDIRKGDQKTQERCKSILLAFLHNKEDLDYKPHSGLVSVACGKDKYRISKRFAITENRKGIIYIYILKKSLKKHLTIKEMNKSLNHYGLKCLEDPYSEIIIQNGLFPHNIIGFFEVEKNSTKRFILNNWFHQQIKHDLTSGSKFNYRNGVNIDQQNFQTAKKEQGYNSFFTCSHVFDMINRDIKPNIEMR